MANPFSDPSSGHTLDSNPFADPSVSNALHSSRAEYGDEEASISSTPKASTAYLPDGGRHDEMSQRIDDLQRREQELAARESQLNAKAEHIRRHGRNNWPPGPFPLLFHDIDMEIPDDHKATVLTLYRIWMLLVIVLVVNLVSAILLLISGANNGGADLGAAIMYVPVIGILSFFTWYRPVYNAYMKESSVFYYIYFFFVIWHILFCIYCFIGIPGSGAAGVINLISRFVSGSIVAGVFCILSTIGWALEGLGSLWMLKQVWAHSHGEKGHTFADAKRELQMHGVKAYLFKSHAVA